MMQLFFFTRSASAKAAAVMLLFAGFGLMISDKIANSNGWQNDKRPAGLKPFKDFTVVHGVVSTILTTPDSTGHELGDQRVLTATPIYNTKGGLLGRLDAELLTTSIDYPVDGDEIRMSTLNFVFGTGDSNLAGSADQIVVSGSGYYPSDESTIAVGDALVRSIVGGSGAYSGASGSCYTEHLADGTWRHTFRFDRP